MDTILCILGLIILACLFDFFKPIISIVAILLILFFLVYWFFSSGLVALGILTIIVYCLIICSIYISRKENEESSKNGKAKSNAYVKTDINSLSGLEFEKYCCSVLRARGFSRIKLTQASNDYGVDIIAYKSNYKYAIQCKRYRGNVGNKAVQEVYSGMRYYDCYRAMVISNSTYTQHAVNTAKKLGVELVTI